MRPQLNSGYVGQATEMRALTFVPTALWIPLVIAIFASAFSSRRDLVRIARTTCFAVATVDLLSLLGSVLLHWRALSASELLQADRQRLISDAIDNAIYNGLLSVIAVAVAWQVNRDLHRRTADSWKPRLHGPRD